MKLNLLLIALGLSLVCLGVYRINPIKLDARFLIGNGPLAVAILLILGTLRIFGKPANMTSGFTNTCATTAGMLPLLLLLMPVIGYGTALAKMYEGPIAASLSGPFGYPIAWLTSIFSPSSTALMGAVNTLWEDKAVHGVLLYFTTVSSLLSLNLFVFRITGVTNTELVYSMYKSSIGLSVYIIPYFMWWNRFMVK